MKEVGSGGAPCSSRFVRISEAFGSLNQPVNLIGVIVEHSPPQRSRGTDYYCTVRIVDDSHHTRGLLVNVFGDATHKLPRVVASGDIIKLYHVVMKAHKMEINAVFNKKLSAFALFEGKNSDNFAPYQISNNFKLRKQDTEFIASLRKWMNNIQLDTVSKESVLLRQIKEGEKLSIVCKILHMYEDSEDQLVLLVWDGSDAPPLPIQTLLEDEEKTPLPLSLGPKIFPEDIISKFPSVGTVLSVHVVHGREKLNLQMEVIGRWVKFISISFQIQAGLWRARFGSSSKFRFVPDEDRFIVKCTRECEERTASKYERMPFTSIPWPSSITETVAKQVAFVTLRDIVKYPEVTAKFHCVVRVVAIVPLMVLAFSSPDGIYRMRFTLEDPTGRIHAYLYGDDGKDFFDGYPDAEDLVRKRNQILGYAMNRNEDELPNTSRNPPWIQCCIKSYYIDKSRPRETRHYRIFGTRILPDDHM